jgi:hypothetical protein
MGHRRQKFGSVPEIWIKDEMSLRFLFLAKSANKLPTKGRLSRADVTDDNIQPPTKQQ